MEDAKVSFRLAKLAVKKGFDWYSRIGNETSLYNKKGDYVPYTNYGFMYSGLSDGYISAPTQSLLQKWLREVHNIHLYVHHSVVSNFPKQCTYSIIGADIRIAHMMVDNRYEEMLEIGLEESLNLLPDTV